MAAPGAGLGAYVQAQKRAKAVEAEIAKAHPHKGISKPGESIKDQQTDGEDEKEEKEPTVASLAKKVVDKAVGTVSSATALKHPHVRPAPNMHFRSRNVLQRNRTHCFLHWRQISQSPCQIFADPLTHATGAASCHSEWFQSFVTGYDG